MADLPPLLRVGTSSFSEKSWIGTFYALDTEPRDMLAAYARRYDTVEIDATYYRSPSPSMCEKWKGVTPEGFGVSLKTPKVITADKALVGCEADWEAFMEAVDCLGPKLRFILLQFGYFNRQSPCPTLSSPTELLAPISPSEEVELLRDVRGGTWASETEPFGSRCRNEACYSGQPGPAINPQEPAFEPPSS
jgi:uncharacterized protein YecE (DUF72 family)